MAYNPPIAFLLTWTSYGTRLHGDARGSRDGDTNDRGGTFVPPSFRYENLRRHQMKESRLILERKMRQVTEDAIRQHAKFKEWLLYALNVRTNHVHLVVSASTKPEELLRQFKAYATRALRAEELIPGRERVWTAKGSKRWLFTQRHIDAACDYVNFYQGRELS